MLEKHCVKMSNELHWLKIRCMLEFSWASNKLLACLKVCNFSAKCSIKLLQRSICSHCITSSTKKVPSTDWQYFRIYFNDFVHIILNRLGPPSAGIGQWTQFQNTSACWKPGPAGDATECEQTLIARMRSVEAVDSVQVNRIPTSCVADNIQ
jgi:hypothetical protein